MDTDTDDRADGRLNKLIQQIKRCERLPDGVTDLDCAKNVYGRIVAEGEGRLQYLSSSKDRKTVFLFGEDAITSLVLRKSPYDSLIELGFTPEYIHYKVLKCGHRTLDGYCREFII